MNKLFYVTLKKIVTILLLSKFFDFFIFPFKHLLHLRNFILKESYKKKVSEENEKHFFKILKSNYVLNGPFKGMLYSQIDAFGSELLPKLIGSYEKELWIVWNQLKNRDYQFIIDIGCAEGYYAIGLGLLYPSSKIIAYDISKEARALCFKLAVLNNIQQRIHIKETCNSLELLKFDLGQRTLIFCDCEGAEFDIFKDVEPEKFLNADLIIEAHDFININISSFLINKFENTHDVSIITSIDDIQKAKYYNFPQTAELDLLEKKKVFSENRPTVMEWIFCKARF